MGLVTGNTVDAVTNGIKRIDLLLPTELLIIKGMSPLRTVNPFAAVIVPDECKLAAVIVVAVIPPFALNIPLLTVNPFAAVIAPTECKLAAVIAPLVIDAAVIPPLAVIKPAIPIVVDAYTFLAVIALVVIPPFAVNIPLLTVNPFAAVISPVECKLAAVIALHIIVVAVIPPFAIILPAEIIPVAPIINFEVSIESAEMFDALMVFDA